MSIWLDVTTIHGWGRPALGIVRVEAEIARGFLRSNRPDIRFCRFNQANGCYDELGRDDAGALLARLDAGGAVEPTRAHATERQAAAEDLPRSCTLSAEPDHPFEPGDSYLSLGLDWDQKDLAILYKLKIELDLKVLLCCYDLIPILLPQHCVAGVPEKFPGYFVNAAWCADGIFCISECSRRDLGQFLEEVGAPLPELSVITLGSEIASSKGTLPSKAIEEILRKPFILFVSTIESRKNHQILYRAYKRIIERGGSKGLPTMVFVGMRGWGVDALIASLQSDRQVSPHFRILDRVTDADLAHLYAGASFTVYPSLYEGWGLPVAESLAYGKLCLASNAASIPEIGGDLVEYLDPLNENAWSEALTRYIRDPAAVAARETEIRSRYKVRTWSQTADEVLGLADALGNT